ncbi:hypothetical protein BVZ31_06455 [Alcaligenes faecalis]|uniref:hypothetical protein n=1 Tax=Alcaligenes faecalis TaxID=511 RepID=UPI000A2E05CC|nr:hypothetical protein [Alcaligenes faecalis]OSZ46063.1 hypothetical protein BVZ30_03625 [Alcaligenes faecalis]OSZ51257.1 hypothetical protein BVZ31_06455 [Alcaligenes faecalis]OSZ53456.1 hypothetical protein BVZ32_08360 [Alcaligenes faecalis]
MSTIIDHKEVLAWIDALDIPEAPATPRRAAARAASNENEDGAVVALGSIPCFVSGLSEQSRKDVQNSTLLMQLAADKKYPKDEDRKQWFDFYSKGLSDLGWGRSSSFFELYQPRDTNVTMNQVVLEVILTVVNNVNNPLYKIAQETFGALNNPANTEPMKLFDQSSTKGDRGKFQILPAGQDQHGNVSMVLTAIQAKTEIQTGSFLFWKWKKSNAWLYRAANLIVLNESVYARVREKVLDKLGKHAEDSIDELEI